MALKSNKIKQIFAEKFFTPFAKYNLFVKIKLPMRLPLKNQFQNYLMTNIPLSLLGFFKFSNKTFIQLNFPQD